MVIDIIGAGKVGRNFAKFLFEHGHTIGHVVNSSISSSQKAVSFIGSGTAARIEEIGGCDLLFIGTQDDKIRDVFLKIKDKLSDVKAVGHFSGAYSSYLLRECDSMRVGRFSLHPNVSFALENVWQKFNEVYFVIEGNDAGRKVIEALLNSLGLRYGRIEGSGKLFYHAAAVFSSNFVVAIMEISKELYKLAGLKDDIAMELASYLARQAIDNVKEVGTAQAITGPVSRGDMKVVKAEEMVLQDKLPDVGSLYHKFVKVLREKVIEGEH